MVRIHMDGNQPSLEGVLDRSTLSHYVLLAPKVLEGPDRAVAIDGHVLVPKGRVLFVQVIG